VKSKGTDDFTLLLSGADGDVGGVALEIFLLFPLRFALRMFFFFILVIRYLEVQLLNTVCLSLKKVSLLSFMMNAAKTIATHSGTFHADESLAVFMLKQLPEYKNAKVIRTRDLELIKQADIAVDVGAIYDPSTHRYDHHQRGFEETFSKEYKIKLSSAGLVYKHFGKKIIQSILKCEETKVLSFIYQKVYDDLILMVF
jgi:hypothetical protein